jgi:hypothetical protein
MDRNAAILAAALVAGLSLAAAVELLAARGSPPAKFLDEPSLR